MRIIVAGGRDFGDGVVAAQAFKELTTSLNTTDFEVVSGGAKGADAMGEHLAEYYEYPTKVFKANWKGHGVAAGPIRNEEMAKYADVLLAFWDGQSKGTKHMIKRAINNGLLVKVVRY